MSCGWGGNHKYGVTLAICHRLKFIHLHCNDSRPLEGRGAPILHICKGLHCTLYVLHHDHSYCERSPGSSDELQTQCQVAADPQIKPTDLDCLQKNYFYNKREQTILSKLPLSTQTERLWLKWKKWSSKHTVVSRPLESNCFTTESVSVLNTFSRFSIAKVVSSGRLCCGSRCRSFCLRRCSLHSRIITASIRPTCTFKTATSASIDCYTECSCLNTTGKIYATVINMSTYLQKL